MEYAVDGIEAADAVSISIALGGLLEWDLPALLAAVNVPVLVLAAPDKPGTFPDKDGTALRGADREAVKELLEADRFVVMEGGHCLHRDHPERWLEIVNGFASELSG